MATATCSSCVEQIGETAGRVWRHLDANGPTKLTQLVKSVEMPKDTVLQALGWLAREDKIGIEDEGRARMVFLRE